MVIFQVETGLNSLEVVIAFDVELPTVVTKSWEVASYIKGYLVYKRVWTPISNEVLQARGETSQTENPKMAKWLDILKRAAMDVLQKQFSTSYEMTPMLSAALRLQESR